MPEMKKADIFATQGAALHEIDLVVANQQLEFETKCGAVMNRLVILGLEATRAIGEHQKRPARVQHPKFSQAEMLAHAVNMSRHTLVMLMNLSWHCATCFPGVVCRLSSSWLG